MWAALGTKWGLFRCYWVSISFVLTTFATSILLLHMPDVSTVATQARAARGPELHGLGGDLFHAGVGLAILLAILALNIAKPPGLTRYGWRRQSNARTRKLARSSRARGGDRCWWSSSRLAWQLTHRACHRENDTKDSAVLYAYECR